MESIISMWWVWAVGFVIALALLNVVPPEPIIIEQGGGSRTIRSRRRSLWSECRRLFRYFLLATLVVLGLMTVFAFLFITMDFFNRPSF